MKKKNLFTLMLVSLLAMTIGIGGTIAYYSKVFTSNDNLIRATRFDVATDGTLNGDVEFDLTDEPISPGSERDVYEFKINKNNTETRLKYDISVLGLEDLFQDVGANKSPVQLKLFRLIGEEWAEEDLNIEIINPSDIEDFRIGVKWDHQDDYDIDYQGKIGKVNIKVVAKQIEDEVEPEPVGPYVKKVVHDLDRNGDFYRIRDWGNLPDTNKWGLSYKLKFKFKDGSEHLTVGNPVRLTTIHRYKHKEAEEIESFDVIICEQSGQFGPYTEVLTIENVRFEGPNHERREIYLAQVAVGKAERAKNAGNVEDAQQFLNEARPIVDALPNGEEKDKLIVRIQTVQDWIDAQ